jgi:hypothetical protein
MAPDRKGNFYCKEIVETANNATDTSLLPDNKGKKVCSQCVRGGCKYTAVAQG